MNQKFKFGDIVKSREYIALLDKPLCFFRYSDEKSDWAECLEQDGTFHFLKVEDLELVPHRDSERLDFIDDNTVTIRFESHFDGMSENNYFRVSSELSSEFYYGKDIRQAIDNAIQQENRNAG